MVQGHHPKNHSGRIPGDQFISALFDKYLISHVKSSWGEDSSYIFETKRVVRMARSSRGEATSNENVNPTSFHADCKIAPFSTFASCRHPTTARSSVAQASCLRLIVHLKGEIHIGGVAEFFQVRNARIVDHRRWSTHQNLGIRSWGRHLFLDHGVVDKSRTVRPA